MAGALRASKMPLSLHEANTRRITETRIRAWQIVLRPPPHIPRDRQKYAALPDNPQALQQQRFICCSWDMSILGPSSSPSSTRDLALPPGMLLGITDKERGMMAHCTRDHQCPCHFSHFVVKVSLWAPLTSRWWRSNYPTDWRRQDG